MSVGGQTTPTCSGGTWSRSVALWAALLGSSACNLASGLSDFEVVGGSHSSASGGGSGGAAGAGGIGGSGTSSGTAGTGGGGPFSVVVQVLQASGDAEECRATGEMYLDSTDLELGEEQDGWGAQLVGLRFENLPVPRFANVQSAWIDFVVDELSVVPTTLEIYGQASEHAFTFLAVAYDLSLRNRTVAAVSWSDVPAWDAASVTQSSPDLSPIVQEIVDQQGWAAGNALVVIIEGTGRRTAAAYDVSAVAAPSLHVEYLSP